MTHSAMIIHLSDYTQAPPPAPIPNRREAYPTTPEAVQHRHTLDDDGRKHGDPMDCPGCSAPGFLDINTPVGQEVKDGAVWYNPYQGWECTECCGK